MLAKRKLISLDITNGTFSDVVNKIMDYAMRRESSYVCLANVHMLVECYYSPSFRKAINGADITTTDGMPLVKSFKLLYGEQQERVDGMNLLPLLLKECILSSASVYFYGGTEIMRDKTAAYLAKNYQDLKVAGIYSPPFRELTADEKEDSIQAINDSGANIVFVVLGCPKQEIWMSEVKGKIPAIMVGIGGALPVLIGMQKRAPKWMQLYCLEWSYRLAQEPKRLFKRYLKTNSHFIYILTREKFRRNKQIRREEPLYSETVM